MNTKQPDPPEWIDAPEVARRFNIGLRTLARWTRHHKLPHIKAGRLVRYNWADLQKAVKDRFGIGNSIEEKAVSISSEIQNKIAKGLKHGRDAAWIKD